MSIGISNNFLTNLVKFQGKKRSFSSSLFAAGRAGSLFKTLESTEITL